jgi:hypothetical protein
MNYQGCKEANRNLWIAVTRTKVTPQPASSGEFLAENARQLQALNYDIELAFTTIQGGSFAKSLAAISFALAAVLAVFAF